MSNRISSLAWRLLRINPSTNKTLLATAAKIKTVFIFNKFFALKERVFGCVCLFVFPKVPVAYVVNQL
jgi:hypothetical protein